MHNRIQDKFFVLLIKNKLKQAVATQIIPIDDYSKRTSIERKKIRAQALVDAKTGKYITDSECSKVLEAVRSGHYLTYNNFHHRKHIAMRSNIILVEEVESLAEPAVRSNGPLVSLSIFSKVEKSRRQILNSDDLMEVFAEQHEIDLYSINTFK